MNLKIHVFLKQDLQSRFLTLNGGSVKSQKISLCGKKQIA